MTRPDILQIGPFPDWDTKALQQGFALHRYFEAEDRDAFVRARADIIRGIATRGELGAGKALIESLPNLEIIAVYGVGYDAVDLDAARERGIRVSNTPGVLTKDVADFGVAMMLAASRAMVGASAWVRSGDWKARGLYPLGTRVHGKRVGILGLGRIGLEIAKRCVGFDMEIAYCDRQARDVAADWRYFTDPAALAEFADFLFVTVVGGQQTRHIINRNVIAALGPSGMLLNISRASTIDEAALLEALETKTLGFAALDVFEGEPDINPRFLALDNVLLQPHIASGTVETRQAMGQLLHENLAAHFAGRPLPSPVL